MSLFCKIFYERHITDNKNLDSNKAHGHDGISVTVMKICGSSVYRPLQIIYKPCLDTGKFPQESKKANVIPVHKKNDKQLVKNYRPIILLPICAKISERILYNFLFNFLNQNDLISPAQSGFKPGDSCINQLLSITHEIYHSMDEGYEIRGIFFDISKVFSKVWHEGLVFKLKQNGIFGNLLNILEDFLRNRKQRVVLNEQASNWENIHAGVPQASIFRPLFFLIYINDLAENLSSNPKHFADDTSLFSAVRDLNTSAIEVNDDLKKIEALAHQRKMSFNPDPMKQAHEVIYSRKKNKHHHPDISSYQKDLGMFLDSKLDFDEYIKGLFDKTSKFVGVIRKCRNFLPRPSLLQIYKFFVRLHLDYGDIIYDKACIGYFQKKIESIQYNVALAITGVIRGTSREQIYSQLGLESLQDRY